MNQLLHSLCKQIQFLQAENNYFEIYAIMNGSRYNQMQIFVGGGVRKYINEFFISFLHSNIECQCPLIFATIAVRGKGMGGI